MSLKNYCEIEDIENYLLKEIELAFESQVEKWIESIEVFIDKYTGRNFKADADEEASVKKYDGVCIPCGDSFGTHSGSNRELFIDECVDVDEVKVDGVKIDPEEYLLYPANEMPKTRIKLKDTSPHVFTKGEQNIEVEGKWGYSEEPPADIKFATTVFVAGIINYSLSHEGEIASETIGNYSVSYKTETQWQDFNRALSILDSYKKILL